MQVTPLGLSAEQMRLSNAEAVAGIEQAAAQKAASDERARLTGLASAFGNDPEFLSKAVADGMSISDAKAAKFDEMATELASVKAENAKLVEANADLRVRVEGTKIPFGGASDDGGQPEASTPESRIEAAWNNQASGAQAAFGGVKEAFVALMQSSPSKLEKYEQK